MRSTSWLCVAAAMLLSIPIAGFTQGRTPLVQSPSLHFSHTPASVRIAGKTHLVYELHITNLRSVDIALTRVVVSDTNRPSGVLGDFKEAALDPMLGQPAAKANLAEPRILAAGSGVVLYVWLPLDSAHPAPTQLSHLIEFDEVRQAGREHTAVRAVPQIVTPQTPVVLGPPLRGDRWLALYDLQHRSIGVQRGERVRQGQVVGLLGNTGSSSSGPHLHFHVSNTPSPLGAEGLPFVLSRFEVQGVERVEELPAANSVVRF